MQKAVEIVGFRNSRVLVGFQKTRLAPFLFRSLEAFITIALGLPFAASAVGPEVISAGWLLVGIHAFNRCKKL